MTEGSSSGSQCRLLVELCDLNIIFTLDVWRDVNFVLQRRSFFYFVSLSFCKTCVNWVDYKWQRCVLKIMWTVQMILFLLWCLWCPGFHCVLFWSLLLHFLFSFLVKEFLEFLEKVLVYFCLFLEVSLSLSCNWETSFSSWVSDDSSCHVLVSLEGWSTHVVLLQLPLQGLPYSG